MVFVGSDTHILIMATGEISQKASNRPEKGKALHQLIKTLCLIKSVKKIGSNSISL